MIDYTKPSKKPAAEQTQNIDLNNIRLCAFVHRYMFSLTIDLKKDLRLNTHAVLFVVFQHQGQLHSRSQCRQCTGRRGGEAHKRRAAFTRTAHASVSTLV